MEFTQSYPFPSSATPRGDGLDFSLPTEAARPGVRLEALVLHSRSYGRLMGALHRVVSQQALFQQCDHSDYQTWVQGQYLEELAPYLAALQGRLPKLQTELNDLKAQLQPLDARANELLAQVQRLSNGDAKSYREAQRKFWNFLYTHDRQLWIVLDPVVSVHPDAVLFEVFSLDESSYAQVRIPTENLDALGEVVYGTTNVDFSRALADELARVRDYRAAFLSVGSAGVSIQTTAGGRVEKKIDLPPSWVRGFLQVGSASSLATTSLRLGATTVGEILRVLNARRETTGPRSLRFHLIPNQYPRIEIEPWGEFVTEPRFVYEGDHESTIRIWGRRRLSILDEILPHAREVEVRLLGDGLPSFWALELEGHRFELGLSGWTQNDWSASARFDLLASGGTVSDAHLETAARELEAHLSLSPAGLAEITTWTRGEATAALQKLCRQGRALFDSKIDAFRWRQLLPFPVPESEEDRKSASARRWVQSKRVKIEAVSSAEVEGNEFLARYAAPDVAFYRAEVASEGGQFRPLWARDLDGRVRFWQCTCGEFRRDKGRSGPCAHLLAGLEQLEKERAQ
ncbi:hypothetical protein IAD21_05100 [Abditibacteriota bacterium]|nr:hypothetical protein IAD21_05100 [Abditibacteriota bacterium]